MLLFALSTVRFVLTVLVTPTLVLFISPVVSVYGLLCEYQLWFREADRLDVTPQRLRALSLLCAIHNLSSWFVGLFQIIHWSVVHYCASNFTDQCDFRNEPEFQVSMFKNFKIPYF